MKMMRYLLLMCAMWPAGIARAQDAPRSGAQVSVDLRDVDETVYIIKKSDGTHRFLLNENGVDVELTPEQFAARIEAERSSRPLWMSLLNISSPIGIAWVTLGLLGQILFTGRMIVQWLASEKSKRSVVPVAFWWMSLAGATMLLIYFAWRKDIIGLLGQATGWSIYVRNLKMIYSPSPVKPDVHADPAPEPEL